MPESETTATNPRGAGEAVDLTVDQLPVEARLRLEHAEMWIAWAPYQQSVVASGEDYVEVRESARRAGSARAFMEWVPPPLRSAWSPQR